ncbi:MAG: fused MFS/spermidine synthase [Candidatus Sulfotelmatobacter sp.]
MAWLFLFFCVSGFCSILYEIIWLRLAMADFGVTSALVSIVLSVFMAGLGLGAWGSGYLIRKYGERLRFSALNLYALTELLIGVSAILVPYELALGRSLLERVGVSSSWGYYLASGTWIALTLIPWCACMGATIPVAMLAIRTRYFREAQRSFSYLYAANVLGATLGTVLPLLLIELRGFHGTLKVGAVLNILLAATAISLAHRWPAAENVPSQEVSEESASDRDVSRPGRLLALLFIGGLTSMGAEIVWIRQFTPYLGTMVYAFASILGAYLISTFVGSWVYRRWSGKHDSKNAAVWALLGLAMLLPLVMADPSLGLWQDVPKLRYFMGGLRVFVGVAPFCGFLGFVTPMLVDRWSGGDPDKAGRAYAVNVVGCILGPLLSGFLLLPYFNERWVLFVFSLPWLTVGFNPGWWTEQQEEKTGGARRLRASYAAAALAVALVLITRSYEARFPKHVILRDNTATSMAVGEGSRRDLRVNGQGMTGLTPITKMMAHLPLASLDHPPQSGLVVCFGMGTTFRSMLSWNIPTTVVELVPSVPSLFWYFHSDAAQLLTSPLSHVEIDDGRRYLERTTQQYDVITIDPPPPVESAGSSLLYSKEFYSTIKQRLNSGGILQQWLPGADDEVQAAIARALQESFAYVRVFHGVTGWGLHFLASDTPFRRRSAEESVRQMPPAAVEDMMEWGPYPTPSRQFAAVLDSEFPLDRLLAASPRTLAMQDDRPVNEYFLLRLLKKGLQTSAPSPTAHGVTKGNTQSE